MDAHGICYDTSGVIKLFTNEILWSKTLLIICKPMNSPTIVLTLLACMSQVVGMLPHIVRTSTVLHIEVVVPASALHVLLLYNYVLNLISFQVELEFHFWLSSCFVLNV